MSSIKFLPAKINWKKEDGGELHDGRVFERSANQRRSTTDDGHVFPLPTVDHFAGSALQK